MTHRSEVPAVPGETREEEFVTTCCCAHRKAHPTFGEIRCCTLARCCCIPVVPLAEKDEATVTP